MAVQTDLRPDTEISREPAGARKPNRVLWPILLLIAMVFAGVLGVAVVANVTEPTAPARVVYPEPNANSREGRVAVTATQQPNANEREGRVPTTAVDTPNANDREGRVPTNG